VPNVPDFPTCYVCGSENPAGLHVTFHRAADGASRAEYVARREHVGWPEIIHGGLLFTLMDEAVAWAAMFAGLNGVTGKAEARFRSPARVGMRLVISGRITQASRRVVRVHSEIREGGDEGPVVAEMDALMAAAEIEGLARSDGDGDAGLGGRPLEEGSR
jgi:acyl-coenzyme A thioesterase PaaI-like protein